MLYFEVACCIGAEVCYYNTRFIIPVTCWSTSSVSISSISTADMFADVAEELVDSESLSPADEFVNTVSIPYTADDE